MGMLFTVLVVYGVRLAVVKLEKYSGCLFFKTLIKNTRFSVPM